MFLFGRKKQTPKTGLVVSVESSHIRACFVTSFPHQKPYIIAESIKRYEEKNIILQKKVLSEVLQNLFSKHPTRVDFSMCVLGSPWFASETNTYIQDEETPFLFRERDVKKILKNTVSDFQNSSSTKGRFSGQDLTVIEKNVLHIGLNGYEVLHLGREHVRRAEVSTYVSVAPSSFLRDLEKEIQHFSHVPTRFQTGTLVQSVVVRDAFQYLSDFVLVAVDGDETEVSIVHDGALVYGNSFPAGQHIVEKKATFFGFDAPSIISQLKVVTKGVLLQESSQELKKVLDLAREEWRQGFVASIQESLSFNQLPYEVVVISKPETFFWVKDALSDARNKHLSISEKNLHGILMNAESVQSFVGSKIQEPDLKLMMYASFTMLK